MFEFRGNTKLIDEYLTQTNFETKDFTLQCWIKTKESGTLLSKTLKHSTFLLQTTSKGEVIFQVEEASETRKVVSKNEIVNDGSWHHITVVKTANFLFIYINGKQVDLYEDNIHSEVLSNSEAFTIGGRTSDDFFTGKMSQIAVWSKALSKSDINTISKTSNLSQIEGLLKIYTQTEILKDVAVLEEDTKLQVTISIKNNSFEPLKLKEEDGIYKNLPKVIYVHEEVIICLESEEYSVINEIFQYENKSGSTTVTIKKNLNKYSTSIVSLSDKDLIDDLTINTNEDHSSEATLVIGESEVVVNTRNFYNFLNDLRGYLKCDQIKTSGGNLINEISYNKASQIFNRRLQFKPLAIIYCESTEDVQRVYKAVIANNLPVRVRSGGHDHEGECSGTDVIVLDLSRINQIYVSHNKKYARIGPGNRFKDLTPKLASEGVMIPHGTCATVGIAGFTFGGGWGPWTRKQGMCCEGLVGATIVLGNGEVEHIQISDNTESDLLWALKGGGGMSYGIITELELKVFKLPEELIKFELEWNPYDELAPSVLHADTLTKDIIKAWEIVIINKDNKYLGEDFTNNQLIGTNLKVSGKHLEGEAKGFKPENEMHNSIMYGYWNGTETSLMAFVNFCFATALPEEMRITGKGGDTKDYASDGLMSAWDRESFTAIKQKIKLRINDAANATSGLINTPTYDKIYKIKKSQVAKGLMGTSGIFEAQDTKKPLPPDLDAPAPHKITSRFANKGGLGDTGTNELISSLTSKLILEDNRNYGLFTYITLGAIVGEYYDNISEENKNKSAFPYKDKSYTIQYQTWWNNELIQKELEQDNEVYNRTNRALDWMQTCRDYQIDKTGGAFISFKDSSIPTETYFGDSYKDLIEVKKKFSEDPLNHLRTRKTII
ncbi:MAG: FAD-binding protein [Algibacter sp.]